MTRHPPSDRLARRPFLAAGAAGMAALAGCADGPGTASLDWVGEAVDADGREHHHWFGPARGVTVTVRQTASVVDADAPVPLLVLLHHREGLRTERLRLRLLAPPRSGSAFVAPVRVQSPASTAVAQTVARDSDGWTMVDLGPADGAARRFGAGNLALEFAVHPTSAPVDTLFVDVAATLRETATFGRRLTCRRTLDYAFVR